MHILWSVGARSPPAYHVVLWERVVFEGIATLMQSWVVCHGYYQVTDLIWSAFNYSAYFICLHFNFILEVLGSWRNANLKVGSAQWLCCLFGLSLATHQTATATSLFCAVIWALKPPVEQLFLFPTFVSTGESAASVDVFEALEPSGDWNFPLCFLQILDSTQFLLLHLVCRCGIQLCCCTF